jgi:hypothetical protein
LSGHVKDRYREGDFRGRIVTTLPAHPEKVDAERRALED